MIIRRSVGLKFQNVYIPQVFPWEFSVLFTAELFEETLSVLSWGPVGGLLWEEGWACPTTAASTAHSASGAHMILVCVVWECLCVHACSCFSF